MPTQRVDALLRAATARLAEASPSPQRDAEALLTHLLARDRSYLRAWPDAECPAELVTHFQALVEQRRQGIPLHYVLGEREFWSLTLRVTDDVLIPRPDTELLVELALARLPTNGVALDAGTGSGAVAVALANERPDAWVLASDNDIAAARVAQHNAITHEACNAPVVVADWLAPFAAGRFDLILANPPYIAPDEPELGEGDVRFEPHRALTAPPDGFRAIQALVDSAQHHLCPNGWLILEHGWQQGAGVRERLATGGYAAITTHRDLAGRERATMGRRGDG
jgi:release factor glutamine methyltransferase